MEKIYGYKEKDVLGLAEFILARKGGTLTDAFNEYAQKSGKAQGTVRNLYYALAKKSNQDGEFCQKYLGGRAFAVSSIVEFDKAEEERLIKAILKEKLNGRSVRSAISQLASGDEKRALRYQNKFRSFIKNKPELVEKYTLELSQALITPSANGGKELIKQSQIKKLKAEINALIEKISFAERRENQKLRAKNAFLEGENAKLKAELALKEQGEKALDYFKRKGSDRVFN